MLTINFIRTLIFIAIFFNAATSALANGNRVHKSTADACAKTTIDFIKNVAAAYGEAEGGTFLTNGTFSYGSNGLIEFAGELNNNQSLGKLSIGLRQDSQCFIIWSEIKSRK